ncbi:MAG: hypothetical protein DDG60_15435 [Anaerolineae bacterium]|nr:MAG: hypothetical protein DDG60_15435 [Anaerolineae bacterium]
MKRWSMKRIILLTLVLFLVACDSATASPTVTPVDVAAIQTSVVQTVVAQATQTALALPTHTPEPSPLPTATVPPPPPETPTPEITLSPTPALCDDAIYVADVSVPDGTQMNPGQEFVKTWRVKNTGTCTWTRGYQIMWSYGDNRMSGQATALPRDVLPGEEVEISLVLKAPLQSGTYSGYWVLRNNNGYTFGQRLSVIITVP